MKVRAGKHIICLWLCLLLHTSITWHEAVISLHYEQNNANGLYSQALLLNIPTAMLLHYNANPQWSYSTKIKWLSHAQLAKNIQAHYLLGYNWYQVGQSKRAMLWLKSAASKGHKRASLLYAQQLTANGKLQQARAQLAHLNSADAKIQMAKLHLYANEFEQARQLLNVQGSDEAINLLSELANVTNSHISKKQCLLSIQFVVLDYTGLTYAAHIMKKWRQDTTMTTLPICFNKTKPFDCDKQCSLIAMAKGLTFGARTLPVIIELDNQKANYNNGVIFLNASKSYNVFKHELFHHFGFVDEYPLRTDIAKKMCNVEQSGYVAENLYVTPKNVTMMALPEGMTAVSTCRNTEAKAYKPVAQLTLMEYMDQPLPDDYLKKALHKMQFGESTMANFEYAYALAFDKKGERKLYLHWLERSAISGYGVAKQQLIRESIYLN